MEPVTFGALAITQLLIATNTISFLSNHFIVAELFCGETLQYSSAYTYERTYIEFDVPYGFKDCIIKLFDGINRYSRRITVP